MAIDPVYGFSETNPLPNGGHPDREGSVDWTDKRLAKITRLRLLSDPGFPAWDVSYCYGKLKDGTYVDVQLPFSQLPKSKWGQGGIQKAIIAHAKRDGVYAKGLGIFDAISTLC